MTMALNRTAKVVVPIFTLTSVCASVWISSRLTGSADGATTRPANAADAFFATALQPIGDSSTPPSQSEAPPQGIAPPDIPPTIKVINCTLGGCHAEQTSRKFLHGPTAVGACTACHQYENPAKHQFKYDRAEAAMCKYCHFDKGTEENLHQPVAEGKCLECHNPHGADERFLPRRETIGDTCVTCHEEIIGENEHIHTPVAGLACTECHDGHSGPYPLLLKQQSTFLCLSCHPQVREEIANDDCVHSPVQENCTECHSPHASPFENELLAPPADLCGSCHPDVVKTATESLFKHSVVLDDERACLNCHQPHGGPRGAELMRDKSIKVCLECHDKEIETENGLIIRDVVNVQNLNLNLHGPLRAGECRGCHHPHGSDHRHLLPARYDRSFYASSTPDQFDLCFTCHSSDLMEKSISTTATRFRNGDENLHFLHINDPKKAGRNCGVCHAIHASTQPVHMNLTVQYGQWKLPIRLEQTDTGGTCAAGCHRSKSYDRENPLKYEWKSSQDAGMTTAPDESKKTENQPPPESSG